MNLDLITDPNAYSDQSDPDDAGEGDAGDDDDDAGVVRKTLHAPLDRGSASGSAPPSGQKRNEHSGHGSIQGRQTWHRVRDPDQLVEHGRRQEPSYP